jgi:hypothetical protein
MALLFYSNGVMDSYKPANNVFTEEEITKIFYDFPTIRTVRPVQSVNTWCVFGEKTLNDPLDLSKVLSEFLKEAVFSPVLFIHDSEIDPEWKATDDILYKSYDQFVKDAKVLLETAAQKVMETMNAEYDYGKNINRLPYLVAIGTTEDKRLMLSYVPEDQHAEFYADADFYLFAKKAYTHLTTNPQTKEPYVIYEDRKSMIIVPTDKVKAFLDSLILEFTSHEEYEICTNISKMIDDWYSIVTVIHPSEDKPEQK